jgi:hypothetical protein
MALGTSAVIIAIGALSTATTAAATAAAVATIAVNVAAAVALTGLTLKVIGTIVRDPGLTEAGTQMGYAAMGLGLFSGGASMLATDPSFASTELSDQAINEVMENGGGVIMPSPGFEDVARSGLMDAPIAATTPTVAGGLANAPQPDAITGGVGEDALMAGQAQPDMLAKAQPPTGDTGGASLEDIGADSGAMPTPTAPSPPSAEVAPTPPAAEGPPTMMGPATGQPVTEAGAIQEWYGKDIVARSIAEYQKNNPTGGLGDWFARQPDWIKATVAMQGLNAVGGGLGGILTGKNLGERLDFDKQVAQWKQDQVAYLNKNNAFAPRVTFPKRGLMNR